MRKEQLKIGNKVRNYNKRDTALYTITKEENGKWLLEGDNKTVKSMTESSVLKNFKLVEEEPQTEIAVTVEIPDMVGYLSQGMVEESEEIVPVKKNTGRISRVEGYDTVTSASLAEELGITPQDLRRILRRNKVEKPEGGWKWQKDSEELKEVRGILEGVQEKRRIRA